MEKKFVFRNCSIRYKDEGYGTPIVLLHGYLESSEIWGSFARRLAGYYRVIRPDIPGHGKSEVIDPIHTMELMAECVKALLDKLSISKCILIGHSLGGYITIAFAEAYPERLFGYCLFHSTPYADSNEKKADRDREIELVKKGKMNLIVNTNIPKGFSNENLEGLKIEIARAREIGLKSPENGIIALLEGMKQRPDRSQIVQKSHPPFLWIFGRRDNYIQFDAVFNKTPVHANGMKIVLDRSGHMGFIEEPEKALQTIQMFINKCTL